MGKNNENDDDDYLSMSIGGNIKYLVINLILAWILDITGLSATALGALLKMLFNLGVILQIILIIRNIFRKNK